MKVLYQSERREPIGPADAQRLLSLRVRKGGDKLFRAFQASVAALIGVEVDAFEEETVSPSPRRGQVGRQAKLDVDNFLVQANGSGIKEALRLILNIELDEPDVMLIEEPEIHLHPALETSVMRYLKRRSETSQVFLTTHSTNFIDSGEYSAIHFVRKNPSTTSVLLTAEQAGDILPQELGLRPSSLFMFEKLVFVEGQSDEDVLREWAATLQCNLSQASVGFITLGGSRNIRHFAARKTTEFLSRRGVEMWFVLDRDESGKEDVAKLQQTLGSNCKIKVLGVREIENYLLQPNALQRYITKRLAQDNDTDLTATNLTVDAITKVIDECAEELRNFSFGKTLLRLCNNPVYINPELTPSQNEDEIVTAIKNNLLDESASLSKRSETVAESISSLKALFEQAWSREKLKIVPGDELLQAVLRRYQLAYRKQRDARQIASLMEVTEIPQEIRALFGEIVPRT